jgi:cytidylate kinase
LQDGRSLPNVIAIDGPVAAGKTTIGGKVARRLGYRFLDTGTMYRAITWLALRRGLDLEDGEALGQLASETSMALPDHGAASGTTLLVNGTPLGSELRRAEVEQAVSVVSRHPQVRRALVERQREIAAQGRVVIAGRDIGTVVLPDAPLKVYLDAVPRERAQRRRRELAQQGNAVPLEAVLEGLLRRDRLDSERAVSPLRPAADAHIVDTQGLTPDEVVERVLQLVVKVGV